jgi:hypothetical protein
VEITLKGQSLITRNRTTARYAVWIMDVELAPGDTKVNRVMEIEAPGREAARYELLQTHARRQSVECGAIVDVECHAPYVLAPAVAARARIRR